MKPEDFPSRMDAERLVWVFHSDDVKNQFPTGVWSDRRLAEEWIRKVGATGILSAYVLNESAYDSNVRLGLLDVEKQGRRDIGFMRQFTTAVDHVHFDSASTSQDTD